VNDLVVGMSLLTQAADQFTGTATYVRELLLEFGQRTGHVRVHGLCNRHALANFNGCSSPAVKLTAANYPMGDNRATRALAVTAARLTARRLARQFADDACVVHYPLTLDVPSVRLPTVLTLHDVLHHDLPQHFSSAGRLWRRICYDAPARRATLVHTVSMFSKARIVDRLGVDADRVVVIPHGVDHLRFKPEPDNRDEALLESFDLPDRFLFYPATLWAHKNHLKLLDALKLVEEQELHLVLCGATVGRLQEILAAAEQRGLAQRVCHLGFVADAALPAVYRRAIALAFPSMYEGFGTPPLEAMAAGCPVASTLVGPLAEVCGGAAIELIPDDPRQMAEAIDLIAGDLQLRARLRAAGLEHAATFSWARAADAHLDAYTRARGV